MGGIAFGLEVFLGSFEEALAGAQAMGANGFLHAAAGDPASTSGAVRPISTTCS
ncbi:MULTISPECIES: hypothetical protein [Streptomyces]|uniref:hypothetical protein n=1 Tax=Streptomyces TaxID=1883 RepID=UPI00131E4693|nr:MULTISPECIES: hypothetical protein [Streptomyces]